MIRFFKLPKNEKEILSSSLTKKEIERNKVKFQLKVKARKNKVDK